MTIHRPASVRLLAGVAGVALVAAACGGGGEDADTTTTTTTDAPTTTAEATTTTTEATTTTVEATTTTEPAEPQPLRQPLTGIVVENEDELLTRPALAVKIDNAPPARRNHTGLAVADLVFEEKVEGDLTRFAAVFQTNDADPVGPIRSGRSQDVDLLSSLNEPLFAWSGGNPGVTRLIGDSFLTDLNAQRNPGYYRGPGSAPHNLYSSTEALYAQTPADHPGAPPQQFAYLMADEDFPGTAVEALDLAIGGIDIVWTWDAEQAAFLRAQEGSPHVDKTYGQITADNVVVLVVDYQPSAVDARSPEAQTLGEGIAYVFSAGEVVEGRWSRELAVGQIRLTTADGESIELTPGNTWVELAENNGSTEGAPTSLAISSAPGAEPVDSVPDESTPATDAVDDA